MNFFVGENGRLRPIWRFALSFVYAFVIANNLAAGIAIHAGWLASLRFEVVYRPVWLALLLLGFSFFVLLLDGVGQPFRGQGLGRPWRHDTWKGIAIGAGMIVVAAACIAVRGTLTFATVNYPRLWLRLLAVVFILATAAMAEELTFRGYPVQRLLDAMGPGVAAFVMSVLFGAVHLGNPGATPMGFINTVLVGGLFCAAYLRTRTLWLPFGMHLGWNATLGTVLGLPVSGLNEFAVFVVGRARGPRWLTGGAYGIEASIVGTAVILLGFLALIAFVPKAKPPEVAGEAEPLFSLEAPPVPQPVPPDAESPAQGATDTPPPDSHPTA